MRACEQLHDSAEFDTIQAMSTNQIALVLQIVGFACASLFIAVLKIERVNKVLGKIKQVLANVMDTGNKPDVTRDSIETGFMMILLLFMISELPRISASMRQRKQITRFHHLKTLFWVYFIGYPLSILAAIPVLLLDLVDKSLVFLVKRMINHEAVVNFMIIAGSFLVFAGLIMEFIASFG